MIFNKKRQSTFDWEHREQIFDTLFCDGEDQVKVNQEIVLCLAGLVIMIFSVIKENDSLLANPHWCPVKVPRVTCRTRSGGSQVSKM